MSNMNPQLMKLIRRSKSSKECPATPVLDAVLEEYRRDIAALDEADFDNPETWPWLGKTNGYIKTLRMLVGHFPLVPSIATAVVLDDSMRILLERRSDDGKWSIPGGVVGPDGSVEDYILRTLSREAGLTAKLENLHLFGQLSGNRHKYPNGDIFFSVKIIYVAKHCSGELKVNYENLELRYFDLQAIPDNVSGSTREIVSRLIDRFDEVASW